MSQSQHPRPVFVAALPREIATLVNGWQTNPKLAKRGIYLYWNDEAVVACAGMGAARSALAVEAALALGIASELISIGWAGGCNPNLEVGSVFYPSVVLDILTGERYPVENFGRSEQTTVPATVLVTVPTPAGIREKARIAESYQASAIDMEAATVARMAQIKSLPFSAIKAISDDATFELPDVARFTRSDGRLREAAFGLHVAMRPSMWRPVAILAKGSKLAARRLQSAVVDYIASHHSTRGQTFIPEQRNHTS